MSVYIGNQEEKAKTIKTIYFGKTTEIPIYSEDITTTETVEFSYANFSKFFSTTNNTYYWETSDNTSNVKLVPTNFGVNSTTAQTTFTALTDLTNVTIIGKYYTESSKDKITIIAANTTALGAVSGTSSSLIQRWKGDLSKGQKIVFIYTKDSSNHASSESSTYFTIACDSFTQEVTTNEIIGYENKDLAKEISCCYIGINDLAYKFYSKLPEIEYSGAYSLLGVYTIDNKNYNIYQLTGSGTLTLGKNSEAWICGGGAKGTSGNTSSTISTASSSTSSTSTTRYGGYGGGGAFVNSGSLAGKMSYLVTIGSQSGSTSITGLTDDSYSLTAKGATTGQTSTTYRNSAQGGRGYATASNSSKGSAYLGGGIETYPFNLVELEAHAAGGAGGSGTYYYKGSSDTTATYKYGYGGGGGSNGGNSYTNSYSISMGGIKGGGNSNSAGSVYPATFYGSGGGGGPAQYYSVYNSSSDTTTTNHFCMSGSSGYQGVCYIAVPI